MMIDTYYVQGVRNQDDIKQVEKTLSALPNVSECVINPETKEITLTTREFIDLEKLNATLKTVGNFRITQEPPIPKARVAKEGHTEITGYTFSDFIPLIIIFGIITFFTLARQWYYGFNFTGAMQDFMGSFFIVFGAFKIINLPGFVEAYQIYDLVAQHSIAYAYAYPFIEVGLGIAYFMRLQMYWVNLFTLVLMLVSAAGVGNELRKGKTIVCACLGAVFKIPMTYVTLIEDLLMAAMALIMLLL